VKSWWTDPTGSHPVSGLGRQANGRRHCGQRNLLSASSSDNCGLLLMYFSKHLTQ